MLAVLDGTAEPVVLVGHSCRGVVITQTAERRPDKIALLVYLCAYLPGDGQSLFELGQTDAEGLILPNLVVAEDGTTATLRPDVVRDALFADYAAEDYQRFGARIVPEPLAAAATPVQVTPERFGRVPRAYIACRCDRAIAPELQRRMHTTVPCAPRRGDGHRPYAPVRGTGAPGGTPACARRRHVGSTDVMKGGTGTASRTWTRGHRATDHEE